MWYGIVGTRRRNTLNDLAVIETAFLQASEGDENPIIVSGGCPEGGDRFAEVIAKRHQVPIMIWYAKWNRLGKRAGFARNYLIAEQADKLIACVAEDRKGGTEDTIKQFLKMRSSPDPRRGTENLILV